MSAWPLLLQPPYSSQLSTMSTVLIQKHCCSSINTWKNSYFVLCLVFLLRAIKLHFIYYYCYDFISVLDICTRGRDTEVLHLMTIKSAEFNKSMAFKKTRNNHRIRS